MLKIDPQPYRDSLAAMGITLYVSRRPLPGAGPSPRYRVAVADLDAGSTPSSAPAPISRAEPRAPAPRSRPPGPAAALDTLQEAPDNAARQRTPAREPALSTLAPARAAAIAPFTVAAVAMGDSLWLEDLQDGILGREQVRLMRAICAALSWSSQPVAVNQFAWPLHNNPQLDLGEEAAATALQAFAQRQVESAGCARLLLLGEAIRKRLGDPSLAVPVLVLPSTRDMLRDARCKRSAWQVLRHTARRD
jgi:hypothetical protein